MGAHLLFCARQPSQCFSAAKACSLVLVVAGTTMYALSKGPVDEAESRKDDHDADHNGDARSFSGSYHKYDGRQ